MFFNQIILQPATSSIFRNKWGIEVFFFSKLRLNGVKLFQFTKLKHNCGSDRMENRKIRLLFNISVFLTDHEYFFKMWQKVFSNSDVRNMESHPRAVVYFLHPTTTVIVPQP